MAEYFQFIEDYCREEDTKRINNQLLDMYTTWFRDCFQKTKEFYPLEWPLNLPQLLTCTDAYLKSRIILFGKEANDTNSNIAFFNNALELYKQSVSYRYMADIKNDKAKNTDFLKARKACAGLEHESFKDDSAAFKQFSGVLINNLNKVSYGGKRTLLEDRFKETIYRKFNYDGETENVFFHEFRILKPRKVIFLCGTDQGYIEHLKWHFGEKIGEEIGACMTELSLDEGHLFCEGKSFCFAENKDIKYFYGYHPSARRLSSFREEYKKKLRDYYKIEL